MKLTKRPSWALGALAAGASIAVAIGLATPARAALSGTDWTSVPLSDGVTQGIADGPAAIHPVSCVSGTTFCVTIVGDLDNIINGSDIGQAALVTTDAGQTWSTNVTLPSTVFPVTALSCATTSVCWASGYSAQRRSWGGGEHRRRVALERPDPVRLGQRRALVTQLHRLRVRDDLLDGRVVTVRVHAVGGQYHGRRGRLDGVRQPAAVPPGQQRLRAAGDLLRHRGLVRRRGRPVRGFQHGGGNLHHGRRHHLGAVG